MSFFNTISKNDVVFLTPLIVATAPLSLPYIANATPRNTTGHGRGEGCIALSRCIKTRLIVEIRNVSPSSSPVFCHAKYRGGVTQ